MSWRGKNDKSLSKLSNRKREKIREQVTPKTYTKHGKKKKDLRQKKATSDKRERKNRYKNHNNE